MSPVSAEAENPPDSRPPTSQSTPGSSSSPAVGSPWASKQEIAEAQVGEAIEGVVSMEIPAAILSDPNPLWRCYVVGHFIGDAPHVGSIHAMVNRIWTQAKGSPRIDVQFIEKNTVLFRIENTQTRSRVLHRKYWHIADIPLVVNDWSPETASAQPDLSVMPMWIDLRGVPSNLFPLKGLRCLSRADGKFVKLHPNTERCTRLDVARVLVEVNLHKALTENISFLDNSGNDVSVEVVYPWLPSKCNVCLAWGHKGVECKYAKVKILNKNDEEKKSDEDSVENSLVVASGEKEKNLNVVNELLKELEEFPIPLPQIGEGSEERVADVRTMGLSLVEQTTNECGIEALLFEGEQQGWSHVNGRPPSPRFKHGVGSETNDKEEGDAIIISPSRFNVLTITEEEGVGEENAEIEEGEVVSEDETTVAPLKGTKKVTKQAGTATSKHGRRKVMNTRDLKLMKAQLEENFRKEAMTSFFT